MSPCPPTIVTPPLLHAGELRPGSTGRSEIRVLFAFDRARKAILLVGGDKTGDNRWYEVYVPKADDLYEEHLETIRKEGLI